MPAGSSSSLAEPCLPHLLSRGITRLDSQMPVSGAHGWADPHAPYAPESVHRAEGQAAVAPSRQGGYGNRGVPLSGVHIWRMFSGGGGLCGVAGEDETFLEESMARRGSSPHGHCFARVIAADCAAAFRGRRRCELTRPRVGAGASDGSQLGPGGRKSSRSRSGGGGGSGGRCRGAARRSTQWPWRSHHWWGPFRAALRWEAVFGASHDQRARLRLPSVRHAIRPAHRDVPPISSRSDGRLLSGARISPAQAAHGAHQEFLGWLPEPAGAEQLLRFPQGVACGVPRAQHGGLHSCDRHGSDVCRCACTGVEMT